MATITINSMDGMTFHAASSLPPTGQGPGLIVIHELFSSAQAIEKVNAAFASQGYIVISPNLFHRQGQESYPACSSGEPEWDQTIRLYRNFDIEAGVRDLLSTLGHIRAMPQCSGKVGIVGSCLGSRMAFLMSSRSDVDCSVCYYGVGLDSLLDEIYDIRMPLLVHLGGQDKLTPPAANQRLLKALSRNSAITPYIYEGADHGFAREDGPTFHPEHANVAKERTMSFLKKCLLE